MSAADLRFREQSRTLPGLVHEPQAVSRADEQLLSDRVHAGEAEAERDARRQHAENVAQLERQLAKTTQHARKHRLATYRQCDNARRAVAMLISQRESDIPMP